MKPIDALTSVPRSVDVSRMAEERVRNGEIHLQSSQATFSKELQDRAKTVNEAPKTDKARIEGEPEKKHGSFKDESEQQKGQNPEEENTQTSPTKHPVKGKILDIRGA